MAAPHGTASFSRILAYTAPILAENVYKVLCGLWQILRLTIAYINRPALVNILQAEVENIVWKAFWHAGGEYGYSNAVFEQGVNGGHAGAPGDNFRGRTPAF